MSTGDGIGQVGNSRVAGKRIAYPDWQRSQSIDSKGNARSEIPVISSLTDAEISSAEGLSEIPTISVVADVKESEAEGRAEKTQSIVIQDATTGEGTAQADISASILITHAKSGKAVATSEIPVTETIHDADTGQAIGTAEITINNETADAEDSKGEAEGNITTNFNLSISQGVTGEAVGKAETTIVTWKAGLGGTVVLQEGGSGVEGAEVVIIRDNDNTQVAKTTTDSDGRWHVTLPGGKTTDSDPEVYSIEVWYRDGPKREKSTTIYNARNRPFIDTADPSERDPYEDDNVEN